MYGADADTEQEYHETSDCSTLPFSVTEVRYTYSRTVQVSQYNPVNPAITVALQVNDQRCVDAALRYAREVARSHVREELATCIPQVMRAMDLVFIEKWLETAPPEQIEQLRLYFAGEIRNVPEIPF